MAYKYPLYALGRNHIKELFGRPAGIKNNIFKWKPVSYNSDALIARDACAQVVVHHHKINIVAKQTVFKNRIC